MEPKEELQEQEGMEKTSVTRLDVKYELERLDEQIRQLEWNVKLCKEQIGQIRIQQEKAAAPQAETGQKQKKNGSDIPRENRQPPM